MITAAGPEVERQGRSTRLGRMRLATAAGIAFASGLVGCSSSRAEAPSDAATATEARATDARATDAKPGDGRARDARARDAALIDGGSASEDVKAPADATDASDATRMVPTFTLDAGSTWTALYRDYFGNPATASCAGDGNCHGSATQTGAMNSNYVCPPGDPQACWAGITSYGDGGADLVQPDASFTGDLLEQVLCKVDDAGNPVGDGMMPLFCSYNFTPVDMQRIQDWVARGAQTH